MSGGHFHYKNHGINDIADEIERIITLNDSNELDEYGDFIGYHFPESVLIRFQVAEKMLRQVSKMVHDIDYLVSGDYGIDSFLKIWDEREGE